MKTLKAVLQHWPVGLAQDVDAHLDHQIRSNAEDVPVKGRMVQLTQRNSVRHDGLTLRMAIGKDMGRLE